MLPLNQGREGRGWSEKAFEKQDQWDAESVFTGRRRPVSREKDPRSQAPTQIPIGPGPALMPGQWTIIPDSLLQWTVLCDAGVLCAPDTLGQSSGEEPAQIFAMQFPEVI